MKSSKQKVISYYRDVLPRLFPDKKAEILAINPICVFDKSSQRYLLFDDRSNPIFQNGHESENIAWKAWWDKLNENDEGE